MTMFHNPTPSVTERYNALIALCGKYRLVLPHNEDWRVVDGTPLGSVNGLPNSRGRCLVTNGILCYIVNEADELFIAHLDWFVPDTTPRPAQATLTRLGTKLTVQQLQNRYGI